MQVGRGCAGVLVHGWASQFTQNRDVFEIEAMRVEPTRAVMALSMPLESSSNRSVERLTKLHQDTICDLITTVGPRCKAFLERTNHRLRVHDVQADEVWGFVEMKKKTRQAWRGDARRKG